MDIIRIHYWPLSLILYMLNMLIVRGGRAIDATDQTNLCILNTPIT